MDGFKLLISLHAANLVLWKEFQAIVIPMGEVYIANGSAVQRIAQQGLEVAVCSAGSLVYRFRQRCGDGNSHAAGLSTQLSRDDFND